jgi:hypothetical protein
VRSEEPGATDSLHAEVLRAGENAGLQRDLLDRFQPDEALLVSVLRRAVPVRFLEVVAGTKPWSERTSVVAAVVLHAKSPRGLSLRLLSQLFWRQLADVAAAPQVPAGVRVKAEADLKEQLRDLRLGERVTLARLATPPVIQRLLVEGEPRVLEALLDNPRLREEDLLVALRRAEVPLVLLDAVVASPRWSGKYAVRLELALQPKTPLPLALLQLSSLVKRDLRRVAEAPAVRLLVKAAAARLLEAAETPEESET